MHTHTGEAFLPAEKTEPDWLASYYQRLQNEYQFSLARRDNVTNWALTLFIAVVTTYTALLTSQIVPSSIWRIGLLLVALGLMIRFFSQSMIAYAFLRRCRYIENGIEAHWAVGEPLLQQIVLDLQTYDHGRRATVTRLAMLWSQLRAGFLLIFLVLSAVLLFELSQTQMTNVTSLLLVGFLVYVAWETAIFLQYDQLKRPVSN
jgi:hypothetical protein